MRTFHAAHQAMVSFDESEGIGVERLECAASIRPAFDCSEANGVKFIGIWKSIADFRASEALYPDGLLELIG